MNGIGKKKKIETCTQRKQMSAKEKRKYLRKELESNEKKGKKRTLELTLNY